TYRSQDRARSAESCFLGLAAEDRLALLELRAFACLLYLVAHHTSPSPPSGGHASAGGADAQKTRGAGGGTQGGVWAVRALHQCQLEAQRLCFGTQPSVDQPMQIDGPSVSLEPSRLISDSVELLDKHPESSRMDAGAEVRQQRRAMVSALARIALRFAPCRGGLGTSVRHMQARLTLPCTSTERPLEHTRGLPLSVDVGIELRHVAAVAALWLCARFAGEIEPRVAVRLGGGALRVEEGKRLRAGPVENPAEKGIEAGVAQAFARTDLPCPGVALEAGVMWLSIAMEPVQPGHALGGELYGIDQCFSTDSQADICRALVPLSAERLVHVTSA
ncbi:hypothetical protein CYMTET_25971, partial [Cymbomonas tetramitiformis]